MDIAFVGQQDGILTEEDREKLAASRHFGDLEFVMEAAHLEDFEG